VKTFLLVLTCLPVLAVREAADPFDPERAHLFTEPEGRVGISGAKLISGGTDPVRSSLLMRTDLQKLAKELGLEVERITPKKPKLIDAENELLEIEVNINLIGQLETMLAFFEELDRSNRGYRIERLDLMPHQQPEEMVEEPHARELGSLLFARIKMSSLSKRASGQTGDWPEGTEDFRRIGVIPALIYGIAGALPRNAWLTELELDENRVTIQGRTHRSDAEDYYEVLLEIPFLVDVSPERPNTIGRVKSKILFAGSALIDLSLL